MAVATSPLRLSRIGCDEERQQLSLDRLPRDVRKTRLRAGFSSIEGNMGRTEVFPTCASGRKLPLKITRINRIERPLLMKADVQPGTAEIGLPDGRFTPDSRRSPDMIPTGCY